jgi:tetratricopeptide (TPR) repeat protein
VIDDAGNEFQDIPADGSGSRPGAAGRPSRIGNLCDWKWLAAEKAFQRVIELEPGSADAHIWYGNYLVWMGRREEGILEGRHAVELDPLSLQTNTLMGGLFYYAHRYDEAIEQLEKVLDIEPNFGFARNLMFWTYVEKEMFEDALEALKKGQDLGSLPTSPISDLPMYAYLHALWGKREEAMRPLNSAAWAKWPAWLRAVVYGALGEKDEAFRLLGQAVDERSSNLAYAKVDPRLDPLRDDPRFQDLLRRMNFPE